MRNCLFWSFNVVPNDYIGPSIAMSNYNSEKFDLSCNDISSIDFINKLQSFILNMR